MKDGFAQLFKGSRWLVNRPGLQAWLARPDVALAIHAMTADTIAAAVLAYSDRQPTPTLIGDVAVINVTGPVTYKSSWFSMYFGCASIEGLQAQLRSALGDPAVKTIVFRCDSPGGTVEMCPEFADELFAARGQKPLLAVADTMVASAAYWIASQADTIYASPSSQLGSIGVYIEHEEVTGMLEKAGIKVTLIAHGDHKVDGNPYEPLSDQAHADLQEMVDEVGLEFEGAVARGRAVTKKVVLDTFGQGRVFRGKEAISLGLADKQGTFGQVLARLSKGRSSSAVRAKSIDGVDVEGPLTDAIVQAIVAGADEPIPVSCCDPGEGTAMADDAAIAAEHEAIAAALLQ